MENSSNVCLKCKGTGIVHDSAGVHTCFDCLNAGRLDSYSKALPDDEKPKLRLPEKDRINKPMESNLDKPLKSSDGYTYY
jgi:hypothetical protein